MATNDVVDISGSSPPPRHVGKALSAGCIPTGRDSDVIVISDSDDERDLKVPPPIRRVLAEAQMNVPLSAPEPGPSAVVDPIDGFAARVLEIIPDVSSDHLRSLLEQHHPAHGDAVVEIVLHLLFEDAAYPRTEKVTGKRKRADDDVGGRDNPAAKIDYASKDREFTGGPDYVELAIAQLMSDFPYIPKPYIRQVLFSNHCFYAPTYFFLTQEALSDQLPYKKKIIPSRVSGKGKQLYDTEFDNERTWLIGHLANPNAGDAAGADAADADATAIDDAGDDDEECEDGIECGCCFSKYSFDKMIQCPDAHLFCRTCCRSYAANLLGQHDPRLYCMDQSGCKEPFPESELARFLPAKLLALYHRVKQQKEIAAAGLEGLEECPFCEYKVVIENPVEKLVRCENEECGAVSCRACKKLDHLPKSCKEADEDKQLDVRHLIEEAMTKALMRNCPKCQKAFVKEQGCNKMTCPDCHTVSCYTCRQVITGYDHFTQPPHGNGTQDPNKCALWDPVEQLHALEVTAAAKRAVAEYKALHPDIADEALNVELPPALPPAPAAKRARGAAVPYAAGLAAMQRGAGVYAPAGVMHALQYRAYGAAPGQAAFAAPYPAMVPALPQMPPMPPPQLPPMPPPPPLPAAPRRRRRR